MFLENWPDFKKIWQNFEKVFRLNLKKITQKFEFDEILKTVLRNCEKIWQIKKKIDYIKKKIRHHLRKGWEFFKYLTKL